MLRIPVTFWKNGKKAGEKLVQREDLSEIKKYTRRECYNSLNWDSLDEEFTHIIYYKDYLGYKKEIQSADAYLGSGLAVTDEMMHEISSNPYIGYIGAFHRPPTLSITRESQEESTENLASELSANILNTFDNPILQCTLEAAKDPATAFAKFLKALDPKFRKDDVLKRTIELVKSDAALKEASVFIKTEHPLFYVIKDATHNKYLTNEESTEDLNSAESFDTLEEAKEFLSDLKDFEDIANYISKEDIQEIVAEEKKFWGEDYEEEMKFADDKAHGIIDLRSAWDRVSFEIIPIYSKTFYAGDRIQESKEKNIKVDFAIPVSEKGRIRSNDAKKLLKKLAALQVLKAGSTYFIIDALGNETCWDFKKSMDPYYTYEFSCEVIDEDKDFYNCLYLIKRAGKLDLKNSEWEAHIVESKKNNLQYIREREDKIAQQVSEFLDDCIEELSANNL